MAIRIPTVTSTLKSTLKSTQCPECCEHGLALVWFCAWCAELEEFGTSDFGVWGSEQLVPCEHNAVEAEAS